MSRYTPPKSRKSRKQSIHGTHMLPTDIAMRRELIDGQDCIVVEFQMPNVALDLPLTVAHWNDFCDNIKEIQERGKQHEHKEVETTSSGLVLPGTEELIEHGNMPRVR